MNLHELEFQVSRANQGAIAALWKKKEIDVFVGSVQTIRYEGEGKRTVGRREGGKNGVKKAGEKERESERERIKNNKNKKIKKRGVTKKERRREGEGRGWKRGYYFSSG